jgi:hypothetical protein
MPPSGKNEARCGELVVLPQHEMGREVAGGPRVEQCRRVGTELIEQIAELLTLDGVERNLHHVAEG